MYKISKNSIDPRSIALPIKQTKNNQGYVKMKMQKHQKYSLNQIEEKHLEIPEIVPQLLLKNNKILTTYQEMINSPANNTPKHSLSNKKYINILDQAKLNKEQATQETNTRRSK